MGFNNFCCCGTYCGIVGMKGIGVSKTEKRMQKGKAKKEK